MTEKDILTIIFNKTNRNSDSSDNPLSFFTYKELLSFYDGRHWPNYSKELKDWILRGIDSLMTKENQKH